jgi:hypothetical protein
MSAIGATADIDRHSSEVRLQRMTHIGPRQRLKKSA